MKVGRNKLILKYPASIWGARWKDALPAGNGNIGAAVNGGTHEEMVMITHEDLWWLSSTPEMPDVSHHLPEVRRLLNEKRAPEADKILAAAFQESGYNAQTGVPLPLGDLKIIMPGQKAFKSYLRTLDMETGEISVSWLDGETTFERTVFVSRTDDVVVCQIRSKGPRAIDAWVSMDLHDRSDARMSNQEISKLPEGLETFADHEFFQYAATNDDGTDFGAVVRVWSERGSVQMQAGKLHISGTDQAFLILRPFIKGERLKDWARLKHELNQLGTDYEKLFESHKLEHGRIFSAMSFQISDDIDQRSNEELLLDAYQGEAPAAMMEKMWSYGLLTHFEFT
jgi:alpha-L-fucosidase 2